MYLDSITLTHTLLCLAEPGKIIVIGKPNRSLDEVLPYLATLPGITPALARRASALRTRREPQAVWCGASAAAPAPAGCVDAAAADQLQAMR